MGKSGDTLLPPQRSVPFPLLPLRLDVEMFVRPGQLDWHSFFFFFPFFGHFLAQIRARPP